MFSCANSAPSELWRFVSLQQGFEMAGQMMFKSTDLHLIASFDIANSLDLGGLWRWSNGPRWDHAMWVPVGLTLEQLEVSKFIFRFSLKLDLQFYWCYPYTCVHMPLWDSRMAVAMNTFSTHINLLPGSRCMCAQASVSALEPSKVPCAYLVWQTQSSGRQPSFSTCAHLT